VRRTDEFTVEVGGQLRILLISKRYVVEADVTTGRDVISHQAKYITAVKSLSSTFSGRRSQAQLVICLTDWLPLLLADGRPSVQVEYSPPRAGTETRTEVRDTVTYILDDEDER
jgi:hypothetical protein